MFDVLNTWSQYVQTKVAEQRACLLDLKRNKKVCKTWTSSFTERLCPRVQLIYHITSHGE